MLENLLQFDSLLDQYELATVPEDELEYDVDARDVREYARTRPPSPV